MRISQLAICLLITLACTHAAVTDDKTVDSSLGIHIHNDFLDTARDDILAALFYQISYMKFPDMNYTYPVPDLFTVTASISNIKLNKLACDFKDSHMHFGLDPNLNFKFS